jgi:adenylate cyclase class IV
VLRIRLWTAAGEPRAIAEVAWKGPTSVSAEGYKQRDELELDVDDGAVALRLFQALGYLVVQAIDRYVEVFELDGAVVRMEWYPRMDVLLEIEGPPEAIERVIRAAGLPREACLPDQLVAFAARYAERTGRPAILSESDLRGETPTWSRT